MLAILLSALFASCKEEIEEEADPYSKKEYKGGISFSTYTSGATRATDVTTTVLKSSGFNVSAWYEGTFYFKDNVKNGTGTKDGAETGKDGIFDTQEDTYYWPFFSDSKKMYFRAFNILKSTNPAAWADDQYKTIKYSVAKNAADQEDLVIAYAEASSVPDNGVQPLNFTHALSKINFSFEGAEPDKKYTINKIEVIAAGKDDAKMTFNKTTEASAPDGSQPTNGTQGEKVQWDITAITSITKDNPLVNNTGVKQGVLYSYYSDATGVSNNPTAATDADKVKVAMTDQNLMLLPQSGKIAVRVYYKIEDGDGKLIGNCGFYETDSNGNHNTGESDSKYTSGGIRGCKTLIVNLGTDKDNSATPATIPAWQAGYAYRFTMTLPTDNFKGDGSNGKDADGVADMGVDDNDNDLDGDGDKDGSEFGMDSNFIEFSVSVAIWTDVNKETNITIK